MITVSGFAGQGFTQLGELGLAFLLSMVIGVEREMRHKAAGLRTYTLVGVGAALIMLISKYGFMNILENDRVVLDPSRIAAQIVTGIGFIGGGLIFVRKDNVRGLTTAAIVWVTAAIGMACGAGLPILAFAATGAHFVVVLVFPYLARALPRSSWTPSSLYIAYDDDSNVLPAILAICTRHGFAVSRVNVRRRIAGGDIGPSADESSDTASTKDDSEKAPLEPVLPANAPRQHFATVSLDLHGTGDISKVAGKLAEISGVISVGAGDVNVVSD